MWMILAQDPSVPWYGALLAALAGGAGVGALIKLLEWWSKERARRAVAAAADRRTSTDEWREIVSRQDAQIEVLQRSNDKCHETQARLCQVVVYLHGVVGGMQTAMAQKGMATTPVVSLRDLLGDLAAMEFEAKTTAQGSVVLHAEAAKLNAAATPEGVRDAANGGGAK
jgi:hypothetical protein